MSATSEAPPFRFIVMYKDKYYLTHELWEFDPNNPPPNLDENQKTSLNQIAATFDGGTPTQGAVEICSEHPIAFTEITRLTSSPRT